VGKRNFLNLNLNLNLKTMYTDFTQMPVYQKEEAAMKAAYELAVLLPSSEKYAMAAQIKEAALSITGNIAEAFGHQHKKDKLNFYYFSRGTAQEVRSHIRSAVTVRLLEDHQVEPCNQLCLEVVEDLNKIIKSLSS
jgi:four helix bundle protein